MLPAVIGVPLASLLSGNLPTPPDLSGLPIINQIPGASLNGLSVASGSPFAPLAPIDVNHDNVINLNDGLTPAFTLGHDVLTAGDPNQILTPALAVGGQILNGSDPTGLSGPLTTAGNQLASQITTGVAQLNDTGSQWLSMGMQTLMNMSPIQLPKPLTDISSTLISGDSLNVGPNSPLAGLNILDVTGNGALGPDDVLAIAQQGGSTPSNPIGPDGINVDKGSGFVGLSALDANGDHVVNQSDVTPDVRSVISHAPVISGFDPSLVSTALSPITSAVNPVLTAVGIPVKPPL